MECLEPIVQVISQIIGFSHHGGDKNLINFFTALGHTVSEIDVGKAKNVFDKTLFSMVIPEVEAILSGDETRKSIVLFGIEVRKYIMFMNNMMQYIEV